MAKQRHSLLAETFEHIVGRMGMILLHSDEIEEKTVILIDDSLLRLKQWAADVSPDADTNWLNEYPDADLRRWIEYQFQIIESIIIPLSLQNRSESKPGDEGDETEGYDLLMI